MRNLWIRGRAMRAALVLAAAIVAGGCAATDVIVDLSWRPVLEAQKNKGTIHVAEPAKGEQCREWVLGKVTDRDGTERAKVVSFSPPEEAMAKAFSAELENAGYRVERAAALPEHAAMGVRFTDLRAAVNKEVRGVSEEAKAEAELRAEVVRDGKPVKTMTFLARTSKTGVRGSTKIAEEALRESVTDLMRQAVPGVLQEMR